MKLVAEILTGSLFYVEVEDDATVGDLKKKIGKQENLPGDRLILLLDGADDEERSSIDKDEAPVKDYGVKDGSHIYIFFQTADTIASFASSSTPKESASSEPSNTIASFASPSTPKESASSEPSNSMDPSSGPAYNKDKDEVNEDEPPCQENPSDEANVPSASIDKEE